MKRSLRRFAIAIVAGLAAFVAFALPAAASYVLYDDQIYSSYDSCNRRGSYLKNVTHYIDGWVCAKGYTQHVTPRRYGILLEVCYGDGCKGGSWRVV